VDQATVTEFIRLRDRFTAGKGLLQEHITLSQFFDVLESRTIVGVRFSKLQITVTPERTAEVSLTGTARTFNTLASQAAAISAEKRIKRAIFSGIGVDAVTGLVRFDLKANLEPDLVVIPPARELLPSEPAAPKAAPATTTATTTSP
jgi:hypothetical protein